MKDLKILEQLYNGYHLEEKELERAIYLVSQLKAEVERRLK